MSGGCWTRSGSIPTCPIDGGAQINDSITIGRHTHLKRYPLPSAAVPCYTVNVSSQSVG
ncbi:protein of unknown function [Candidatus Methylomirabilis oxygeniifera]|uniref:Uncharacterized protein n=1 Tax=Methylomirabilis oxygeniifera TaxID=671143 RepID=D5MN50_METO1|nr:protein of unknown function [Candidatus Methylomirabilis oxyfera]